MKDSLVALKKDKHFASLIKLHGEPDLKRGGNLFQALVRSVVSQQVSTAAARTIYGRFVMLFNKPNTPASKLRFPKPEEVLKVPFLTLRQVGLSGQKATYIQDIALKFTDGTIKHKSLHKMSSEEVTKHLTQVKGVGVWTVHMLQIFTLGRLDVLPTGDLAIKKAFQNIYKLKSLPTHAEMEKIAAPWREHASVASWYLWRSVDDVKKTNKIKKPQKKER